MKIKFSILALLICLFASTLITPNLVKANEEYLKVIDNKTYIYQDFQLTTPLFIVDEGYFLKIDSITNDIAKVSYGDNSNEYPIIFGYVNLSKTKRVSILPTNPYAITKIYANYSDVLFNDFNLNKAYFNVPNNTVMRYYGEFIKEDGKVLCYVYCNNKLGYIDKSSLNDYVINKNLEDDAVTPDDNTEEETENTPSTIKGDAIQIIIIIGISVISISIVYALFKPNKVNKTISKEIISDIEE